MCETEVGIEGCGRFCSELHDCYRSPYIVNIIIARKIIHMWNVACMWYRRRQYKVGLETVNRRNHLGYGGEDNIKVNA